MDVLTFLAAPFVASLVWTGILVLILSTIVIGWGNYLEQM